MAGGTGDGPPPDDPPLHTIHAKKGEKRATKGLKSARSTLSPAGAERVRSALQQLAQERALRKAAKARASARLSKSKAAPQLRTSALKSKGVSAKQHTSSASQDSERRRDAPAR